MAQRRGVTKPGVQGGVPLLAQKLFFAAGVEDDRMGLRFFVVPVRDSDSVEQELNGFLTSLARKGYAPRTAMNR